MNYRYLFLFIAFSTIVSGQGKTPPFSRGVNLSAWFQESSARQIRFTKYTREDFRNITSLGCDVVRVPINMTGMTNGAPNYTFDPLFFDFIDEVVDWAEETGLHIILDNHSFDAAVVSSPLAGNILVPLWKQMATHMKERSALVYYEILNEPHDIADNVWNAIQKMVVDSIRAIDTKHTIIVGPAGWNSLHNLSAMPHYADTNLIYTFHFYDPFIFTHQGASWTTPSMEPLAGVPFPYDAARMPAFPAALNGTWIQNSFNGYASGGTVSAVKSLLDIAANFKNTRNIRLYCGEFGVYKPNSIDEDRVRWYDAARQYLEEKGIAWTTWDYRGGFGLFEEGTGELFAYDVNVPLIGALGLTVPPQSDFILRPDSAGFDLYRDYPGPNIAAYANGGVADFYSAVSPAAGKYSLRFGDAQQYESILFAFTPVKDLSLLKQNGYVLEFKVRSASPGVQFDIRFVDTKTGPADHPWRMRKTITSSLVPWDGAWHQLRIPLSSFTEHGSYDGGWFNPVGAFDWKAIDHFAIVAEPMSLAGMEISFDDIRIAPLSPGSVAGGGTLPVHFALFQNFPNPFNPATTIRYQLPAASPVTIRIYNVLGQTVETLVDRTMEAGVHSVQWKAPVPGGVYFCRMQAGDFVQSKKLLLMK